MNIRIVLTSQTLTPLELDLVEIEVRVEKNDAKTGLRSPRSDDRRWG